MVSAASGVVADAADAAPAPSSEARIRRGDTGTATSATTSTSTGTATPRAPGSLGAALVSDQARRVSGNPLVRRNKLLRHAVGMDWAFTLAVGAMVAAMAGFVVFRWRRSHHLRHGGSV